MNSPATGPNWTAFELLATLQGGYFTAMQLREIGFSPQLTHHYASNGTWERIVRGVYHRTDWPRRYYDDLIWIWLWSKQEGVWSHRTALGLYALVPFDMEVLHLTVPRSWASTSHNAPSGVRLHGDSLRPWEIVPMVAVSNVPVTTPLRSVLDCIAVRTPVATMRPVARHALEQGMFTLSKYRDEAQRLGIYLPPPLNTP